MAFLNTDRRLILPLLLLTAAFIGLAVLVWENNTLAPDEFGKIVVQEDRLGEIQTLVADMARQQTEKEKKLRDMAAAVMKELAGVDEKAAEITAEVAVGARAERADRARGSHFSKGLRRGTASARTACPSPEAPGRCRRAEGSAERGRGACRRPRGPPPYL